MPRVQCRGRFAHPEELDAVLLVRVQASDARGERLVHVERHDIAAGRLDESVEFGADGQGQRFKGCMHPGREVLLLDAVPVVDTAGVQRALEHAHRQGSEGVE